MIIPRSELNSQIKRPHVRGRKILSRELGTELEDVLELRDIGDVSHIFTPTT